MKQILLWILLFGTPLWADGVLIITCAYNRPDFIPLQYHTFTKFLKEPFSFVIFNDAPTNQLRAEIETTCTQLGVQSIPVPPSAHGTDFPKRYLGEPLTLETRGIQALQYALRAKGIQHDGIVMLIDSDIFLVKPFSVANYLGSHAIAGLPLNQDHISYIWSGLVILNMAHLPHKDTLSFYPGRIGNTVVGAGGFMHHYLKNNAVSLRPINSLITTQLKLCDELGCVDSDQLCIHNRALFESLAFDEDQIAFLAQHPRNIEFLCNNTFLHYRGGSNWDAKSKIYITKKTDLIRTYLETILIP